MPFAAGPTAGGLPGAPTASSTSTGGGCGDRPGRPAVPFVAVNGNTVSSSRAQLVPPSALSVAGLLGADASLPSSYKCLHSSQPQATTEATCHTAGVSTTRA